MSRITTPPTTPNTYTIVAGISGTFTVGVGGNYATLTAAVADLNIKVMTGPVVFLLIDASYPSETFPITINANGGSSATNTLTIKPNTGVTAAISGSSASALLVLNGADYVTLTALTPVAPRVTSQLRTRTGTSSAVVWGQTTAGLDAATNDTIKNVNLVGSGNTQTLIGTGFGSATISISSLGTGNNSNTIQNNNISKTQYGIYSGGASAANKNTGTVITQNAINTAAPNNVATGAILVNFDNGIQITRNDIGNILKHDGTTGSTGTAFAIALGIVPNNTVTTFTGSDVTNAIVSRTRLMELPS